jgi:hypothetical protein
MPGTASPNALAALRLITNLNLGDPLNRQVSRLFTLENAARARAARPPTAEPSLDSVVGGLPLGNEGCPRARENTMGRLVVVSNRVAVPSPTADSGRRAGLQPPSVRF